jgi:hypothetical protein
LEEMLVLLVSTYVTIGNVCSQCVEWLIMS